MTMRTIDPKALRRDIAEIERVKRDVESTAASASRVMDAAVAQLESMLEAYPLKKKTRWTARDVPTFDSDEEDALAVAAFDRAMTERTSEGKGDAEPVPLDLVLRLSNGESPIKVWREFRQMTQAALAKAAGLKQGSLSDLERGRREASFQTMCRLADALGVELDQLRPPAD